MGRPIYDIEVEVLVDGTWYPGWLDPDWRRDRATGRWLEDFVCSDEVLTFTQPSYLDEAWRLAHP